MMFCGTRVVLWVGKSEFVKRAVWLSLLVAAALAGTALNVFATENYWLEDFNGSPGTKPGGWYDDSDDQTFHAMIYNDAIPSYADVSVTAGEIFGKVVSFSQDVNVAKYSKLEVVVSRIPVGDVKVGVFNKRPVWKEHVSDIITAPGTYTFDIPTLSTSGPDFGAAWSGVQFMGVEIFVEGNSGEAVFDSVRIYAPDIPTTTPTMTPTLTALFPEGGYATPNPFLPLLGQKAIFNFRFENPNAVYSIRIYNLRGHLQRTLNNTHEWDGRSESGNLCEGGVYVYQIEAEGKRVCGKVVLIK